MLLDTTARTTIGWVVVAMSLVQITACSDSDGMSFGDRFLFGPAIAGFQSDMGCPTMPLDKCRDAGSDWYRFVTDPRIIASRAAHVSGEDPARVGPGFWELYREDIARARRQLHSNAFRLSIEWSRIFPRATDDVSDFAALRALADRGAVEHYHRIFAELRAQGLEPLVTLHHYTLPHWIHDGVACHLDYAGCKAKGWRDRKRIVREIAKYAGFVAREFGDQVDLWTTQNEPFAVLLSGFIMPSDFRTNPPASSFRIGDAKRVLTAMVEAHARMYDAVKREDREDADGRGGSAEVGLVYAMAPIRPRDPSSAIDRSGAKNAFYLWNLLFLDAVALGKLDERFDGKPVRRADLAGRLDFVGINYKVAATVQGTSGPTISALSPLTTFNPLTIDYDNIDPKGIYEMTKLVSERYELPVYITENNGQAVPRHDLAAEKRVMVQNLQWLARARSEGARVRGFFYWSLTDNYEWNHGTKIRLGLYRVDGDDPRKRRVARPTVEIFAAIARDGRIPRELAERYPTGAR